MSNRRIIAADIGNSRAKIFAGDTAQVIGYDKENIEKNIEKILRKFHDGNIVAVPPILAFSSVNPPIAEIFFTMASSLGLEIFDAAAALDKYTAISFEGISGMGSDRKFGLLGARERAVPPFITVDCGTAITINAVDKIGNCIGGVIFPGFKTQLASLAEKTANLYTVPMFWEEFSAGINTEQAIRRGIIHATAAGASHIIECIAGELGSIGDIPVFLTGGGLELMREEIGRRFAMAECPNLVCEGIIAVADRWFNYV